MSSQAKHLWEALGTGLPACSGSTGPAGGDEVFQAVGAGPGDRADQQAGLDPGAGPSSGSRRRRIPRSTGGCRSMRPTQWRQRLAAACAAHVGLGPATLVLYDVTTLYFETDEGDGFREPGFSKERRLEPQITVGLLTDVRGFPLQVHAFEGNTAETKTILPVIAGVRRRARAAGGDRGRRRRDAVGGQPGSDLEDAGLTVHRRRPDPRRPLPGERSGDRTHPDEPIARRADLRPADGDGHQGRPAAADDLLPVPRRPGQADPEGHRPADRQSGEGGRRAGRGEAEPVRPAHRRHQDASTGTWRPRPAPWPG